MPSSPVWHLNCHMINNFIILCVRETSIAYKSNVFILHITLMYLLLFWPFVAGEVLEHPGCTRHGGNTEEPLARSSSWPSTYPGGSQLELRRFRNSILFSCQNQTDASEVYRHSFTNQKTYWLVHLQSTWIAFPPTVLHITIREAPVFDVLQGNQIIKLEVAAYGMEQSG